MKRITYEEMPAKLVNNEDFHGNSVKAITLKDWYYVYSYNTLIFKRNKYTYDLQLNATHYSSTTSKLQRMLEKLFNIRGFEKVHDIPRWAGDWE